MKKRLLQLSVLSLLVLAVSSTASANLVTNGGFETHDLTGWSTSGETSGIFVCGVSGFLACDNLGDFHPDGAPHSGDSALAFGPGLSGTLQQTITTVVGQDYDVSFWLEVCVDGPSCNPNSLTVQFGGTTLFSQSNLAPSAWTQLTFSNVTATSSSSLLSFSGLNEPSFFLFDDISVTTATAVPEPASLPLLCVLLAGFAAIVFRRKLRPQHHLVERP